MPALAVWTPEDGLAGALVPLGIAASVQTALLVDLDPRGPAYPGRTSLAELVSDGPRRSDLEPDRAGTAVLRNGGIEATGAVEVLEALVKGWPHVVLRLPPRVDRDEVPAPVVRVHVDYHGLFASPGGPAVHQLASRPKRREPAGGVVLPVPAATTWRALATGRRPPFDRWLRACRSVWEFPWTR